MAGLLYKDFIAVHGKIYVAVLLVITVLLALFPVVPISPTVREEIAIVVGALVAIAATVLPLIVVFYLENSVISADDGAKKKAYLMSLPVSKRQYVASKYLFILICYYVFLSVTVIWAQFANICMGEVLEEGFLLNAIALMPFWIQALLLVSALELPVFINVGVKAGNAIKTTVLFAFYFAIFAYMLFGDMTIVENFSLVALLEWMEAHLEITMTLQVLAPVIVGGLYYLSYRIAAALFERREQADEE